MLAELVTRFEGKAEAVLEILETAFDTASRCLCCRSSTGDGCARRTCANGGTPELRRRERVISVFPNDDSATRLIGGALGRAARDVAWRPTLSRYGALPMETGLDDTDPTRHVDVPPDGRRFYSTTGT